MLCRTVGKRKRNHCMAVSPGKSANMLLLSNNKAGVNYPAVVLKGLQLSRSK